MARRITPDTEAVEKACPICHLTFTHERYTGAKPAKPETDLDLRAVRKGRKERDALYYEVITCPTCSYSAFEADYDIPQPKGQNSKKTRSECIEALAAFGVEDLKEFTKPRGLRHAIGSYACAEIWYRGNPEIAGGPYRRGLCGYRLLWLLTDAQEEGMMTSGEVRATKQRMALVAESCVEQAFLSEKFPARYRFGPDVFIDFGPAVLPYMVSYLNYLLSVVSDEDTHGKELHLQKAEKYGVAASSQACALKNDDIQRKAELLNQEIKKRAGVLGLQLERSVSDAPQDDFPSQDGFVSHESYRWELPFEKLFEKHGRTVKDREVIMRQGEESYHMYFILSGMVAVVRTYDVDGEKKHKLLATLGEGAFFGEMALVDSAERFATVRALAPTRLIEMDYAAFKKIIERYPQFAIRMIEVLIRRLRYCDLNIHKKLLEIEHTLLKRDQKVRTPDRRHVREKRWAVDIEGILHGLMKPD